MGTTGRESESLREPEREENAGLGWVLGAGGQIGKKKETIQCSKHLLSTCWVLKSRVQGGHSESLRSDWLTGKGGRGDGFFNDSPSLTPHLRPLWTNCSTKD